MYDLSYKKTRNKGRSGKRGPKQRYAVFRAELNIELEEDYERWSKVLCELNGLNIEDFKIDCPKNTWAQTCEGLKIHLGHWPYKELALAYIKRRWSQERQEIILGNMKKHHAISSSSSFASPSDEI